MTLASEKRASRRKRPVVDDKLGSLVNLGEFVEAVAVAAAAAELADHILVGETLVDLAPGVRLSEDLFVKSNHQYSGPGSFKRPHDSERNDFLTIV